MNNLQFLLLLTVISQTLALTKVYLDTDSLTNGSGEFDNPYNSLDSALSALSSDYGVIKISGTADIKNLIGI